MSNFGNKMKDIMSDRNNQIYFGVFVVLLLAGIGAYYFFKAPSTEENLTADTTDVENVGEEMANEGEMDTEVAGDESAETTEESSEDSEYSSESTEEASEETDTVDGEQEAEYAEESTEAVAEETEAEMETSGEENQFASETTEEAAVVEAEDVNVTATTTMTAEGEYVIVSGDWLSKIAQRVYGDMHKWTVIHEMNPQIENPHLIYPGQKINLESR